MELDCRNLLVVGVEVNLSLSSPFFMSLVVQAVETFINVVLKVFQI